MNRLSSPGLLTITASTTADDTHVCTIGGEIDALTAPTFQEALFVSLGIGGSTVVDLKAVTFFGVAGIRALLAAQDFADRCHCEMCIDGSYCVTRVLEATGLAGRFELCPPRSTEPAER
ncbi:STAS domain-containing protein [Nocardia sp. CA-151230]|uniref:STAS domain-containing protein n=1 Tax=Nocardia sp. CA-151230 TaxID=3239982 RepID=UPI003D8BD4F1